MVPFIYGPQEHHGAKTPAQYRSKHAAFINKNAANGRRFQVHDVADTKQARVDNNTWVVDCDCGNGCAADADWSLACCYGCGAIYTSIDFPDKFTMAAIEGLLIARPKTANRNWQPTETVQDLTRENAAHGIAVEDI